MTDALMAPGKQISPHPWAAVGAIALLEAGTNLLQQLPVDLRSLALRSVQPLIKSSTRNPLRLAHLTRLPGASVLGNEGKSHCGSLAKKPMAFFKISRSA